MQIQAVSETLELKKFTFVATTSVQLSAFHDGEEQ